MTKLIDKAVGLEDMTHALNVIELLERTYPGPEWPGALLFQDLQAGFLLIACFDPELYPGELPTWESLFPPRDLRDVTMEQACWLPNRYRPWLGDGVADALRQLKLLPA